MGLSKQTHHEIQLKKCYKTQQTALQLGNLLQSYANNKVVCILLSKQQAELSNTLPLAVESLTIHASGQPRCKELWVSSMQAVSGILLHRDLKNNPGC